MIVSDRPTSAIQRRAKLFEVGDYPDKGVTVTGAHLDGLVQSFSAPVPVLIEHAESPLEIGQLVSVQRVGDELFGAIELSTEASALVDRSEARSLSLGLSPDLAAIREVSLVRHPRIASARLFGGDLNFVGAWVDDLADEWRRLREAKTEREVDDLVGEGRLAPAQTSFARSLLSIDQPLEFDGQSSSVRALTLALIRHQPKLDIFSEVAPTAPPRTTPALSREETDFYRQHFPNVSLDEIAAKR